MKPSRCSACRQVSRVLVRKLCAKCAPKLHQPVRLPAGVPIL